MTRLQARVKKAKAAAAFAGIVTRDKDGKAKTITVPGTKGKQYQVIVRRITNKKGHVYKVTTECRVSAGGCGYVNCPGNPKHVCYHSLAAFLAMAKGHQVAFCSTWEDAKRLSHLNQGKVGILASHNGSGRLYTVVSKER